MKVLFGDKAALTTAQRIKRLGTFTTALFLLLLLSVASVFYLLHQQYQKAQLDDLQQQADNVTRAIGKRIFKHNVLANSLSSTDFEYYQHLFNPVTGQLTRALSTLSNPDLYSKMPGLLGYFQLDSQLKFNNPACPTPIEGELTDSFLADGTAGEMLKRRQLTADLYRITQQSAQLKQLMAQPQLPEQTKFDALLDVPGFVIYYRVVDINGEKKLQGYVMDKQKYLSAYTLSVFNYVTLSTPLRVVLSSTTEPFQAQYTVAKDGSVTQVPDQAPPGEYQLALLKSKLQWPYQEVSLSYSARALPLSAGARYSLVVFLIITLVIGASCLGFYRLGVKQLKHAEQRLNFVSAVSHELKTPVTSIRMYAEMLAAGQVLSSGHQQEYFQFISSESERLTRLIDNVLQLAKLNQPQQVVQPQYLPLSAVEDMVQSKLSSVLLENDFVVEFQYDDQVDRTIELYSDGDVLSQVVINIVDNSIKFFATAQEQKGAERKIDFNFGFDKSDDAMLKLSIRDYGPGVSEEQLAMLFDLFYRGGDELTRSTQGTGIGLALVKELLTAQQGGISADLAEPGLVINLLFKHRRANS